MTTHHFPVEFPLAGKSASTVSWKDSRPLFLGTYALEGTRPGDRPLRYTPISIAVHAVILTAFLLGPLLGDPPAPEPAIGLRAFFAEPGILAPPPPPPPPPAAAPRAAIRPKTPDPIANPNAFVAPVEVPDQIARPSISFADGGVAGGVEGGVEGGVAGGIVGGLPAEIAPLARPQAPAIRVGGDIRAPKRTIYVPPEYPLLASQAGVEGMVILEARVGTDGRVREATVLRGQPLFDDPARAAVLQWRYQPLLLNGVAMEFILTVTVQFSLRPPA